MSWWLFLPLAYLALGFNLIGAGELAWRGTAPDFVLLLWSVSAVRSGSARALFQACLLGLLADLGTGHPPGATAAAFVVATFLLDRIPRGAGRSALNWPLWGFPLMVTSLVAVAAGEWMLRSSAVPPQQLVRFACLTAAVTFGWGVGLKLAYWAIGRLCRFPRESAPRELQGSSFFLSR